MLCFEHSYYYYCIVDPFSPSRLLSIQDSSLLTGMIFFYNGKRNSLYVRCMENHIKTSMLIVEKKGMLYILKLVC